MRNKQWDAFWINAQIATCVPGEPLLQQAALAVKAGHIVWIGHEDDLPAPFEECAYEIHNVAGRCITPGLIDCHTHLVYAGNRANEFEMRLRGVSYKDIAAAGGGIQATVKATRAATKHELLQQSIKRARSLLEHGATTIEIKSGYGLDWATEMKMLRVAKEIGEILPLTVKRTFLGAHTIPEEYRDHSDDYVDVLCNQMIPTVAQERLADSVDVFCESIAFNLQQTERIFKAAKDHGLAVRCHAEQLSASGAAALAAKYQALSVDHLEFLTEEDVIALAKSGTVAVLLPGAFYYLQEERLPPIDLLRKHKVPIAIASDCNPGTSPVLSMLIILNLACVLFKLTPEEALLGATYHAAKALALDGSQGSLAIGKAADFVVWDVSTPNELAYYLGGNPLVQLIKNGSPMINNL